MACQRPTRRTRRSPSGANREHEHSWRGEALHHPVATLEKLCDMIRIVMAPPHLAFVLAALVAACGGDAGSIGNASSIGGTWTITTLSTLPEAGAPQHFLNRGTVRVDELVKEWRYFDPDCVVYRTSRGADLVYAVCGERTPVAIASYEMRPWSFDADGIHRRDDFIPIAEIRTVAEGQPAFRDDWTQTVPAAPVLKPVKRAVAPTGDDLVEAAGNGSLDQVDRLLRAGVSPNAASYGVTPLIAAAVHGHAEVVQRLIAAGADVNFRDRWGMTALDYATREKHPAAIDALGRAGRP